MPDQPPQPQPEERASYVRTGAADMMVNDPAGYPSDPQFGPVWWFGSDTPGGGTPWVHGGVNSVFGPQYGSAAALPVVIRATALVTGPLTSAPFRQIDLSDGHPLGRARWMTDPMLLRSDARYASDIYPDVVELPRGTFWMSWIRNAIWWGLGAFLTQLDETGQPLAGTLRNIDSRLLTTERDSQGALHWVLGSDGAAEERATFDRNGLLSFGSVTYRLVTLRNPHSPVDANGYSKGVFALSPGTFGMSAQIEEYARGQFKSGVPNGILKVATPGLTQEQATDLKTAWMSAHGNDRRSIGILNAVTDFVPFNLSPVDAGLDAVKRLNIGDCAMAFGLDPLTLGVSLGNSATYSNLRDAWNNHKDFGLAPWISAVQDTLSALLPGSQGAVVDLDRFANPPLSERVTTGAAAVAAGLMTVDEWRALEGMQPMAGTGTPEQERNLSAAEVSQKVYLAVQAGVLSIEEARQMIADAGGKLDVAAVPEVEEPEPTGTEGVRSLRSPTWRR
jgi:HK97 family phage portal protein